MAQRIIFAAILLGALVTSLQEAPDSSNYDYADDYYDEPGPFSDSEETEHARSRPAKSTKEVQRANTNGIKEPDVERDREEVTTQRQSAGYEVTELVMDIPDVNTRRIPVITNFTVNRPLNFAGNNNNKENDDELDNDEGDEIFNSIFAAVRPEVSANDEGKIAKGNHDLADENNDEKDYFSHFNTKDNLHGVSDKEFGSNEDHFEPKEEPIPKKSFKDYFHNIRNSIVNKFKSVVSKHDDGIHDSLRKIVDGPISFFNKLHKKSSDLANTLHKAVSRHKSHDSADDAGYHDTDDDHDHDHGYDYS